MQRVLSIRPAGTWDRKQSSDRIVLDADDRSRRRIVLTTESGERLLLDLEKPVALQDGDGLLLDGGRIVEICGRAEALTDIAAANARDFVRVAWHLGNRHTAVQFFGNSMRIRSDHVLEDMLRGLGVRLTSLQAPFYPEPGPGVHRDA